MIATIAAAAAIAQQPSVTPSAQSPSGRLPDRVVLNWANDPATTMAVAWRTSSAAKGTVGEIAVAEDGPDFKGKAVKVEGSKQMGPEGATYHMVEFTGLTPDRLYVYRVGDGEAWSEWNQFQTATREASPFSFVYFGDAQNDVRSMWSRVVRQASKEAPKADFYLHAGDLVNIPNSDKEWGEWYEAGGFINRMTPVIATPGNHEYTRGQLSAFWRPTFALPKNGVQGLEETCFYLDYQGARIVSLNSNERLEDQAPWLDKTLAENPHPWSIVTFHHPVFSTASGRDNEKLRELWKPILDKHKVDIVLQGHDHTYGRMNLATGLAGQDDPSGTAYVVSVSGPKMYKANPREFIRKVGERTQLFQVIDINGSRLSYKAMTPTGKTFDAFDLVKRAGQRNELVEKGDG